MGENIKVSILVPCYNSEKYIDKCINSILHQTLDDVEIICINDGSTDNTLKVLQNFEKKNPKIRVVDKKNSGYGASLNLGFSISKGEYIGIVESDDFIENTMYELLYDNAKKYDLDISRCCFNYYYSDECIKEEHFDFIEKNKVFRPVDNLSIFFQMPSLWCSIYKKNFLEKNNIKFLETPGASYQDLSFCFKVYFWAERYMQINKCLLNYRQTNNSSSVKSKGKVFCVNKEWEEIFKTVKKDAVSYDKIKNILPIIQLNNYRWNYIRIDKKYKDDFLKKWASEWNYLNKNEINFSKVPFNKKEKLESYIILNYSFLYPLISNIYELKNKIKRFVYD